MSNLCPVCSKDDQVQKVSAIVTSGTFTTTYNVPAQGEIAGHKVYGTVQQSGMGKTDLAQALSMPSEKVWKEWKEKQIPRVQLIKAYENEYERLHPQTFEKEEKNRLLKNGCLIAGTGGLVLGILLVTISFGGSDSTTLWSCIIGLILMGSFPLSLATAAIIYRISNPKEHREQFKAWYRAKVEYRNSHLEKLEKKVNDIQRQALSRFNLLYYCYRDDVVFLPETSFGVSSQEMKSFSTWERLGQLD
jgi:hypothetical protein